MEKSKGRWLVIGADGLIGKAISEYLKSAGMPVIEITRRPETVSETRLMLDLAKDISDWQPPAHISTAYLFAAITSLLECRKNPSQTYTVNVLNTIILARKLVKQGVFIVFPSTNLVYDGSTPFQKADYPTCPKTEYGRQKAEAERQLMSLGDKVAIVRFTKILHPDMPLLKGWIETLKKGEAIHPFSDMVMSPIPLGFASEVFYRLAEQRLHGIIQVSGKKDVTYEQVAYYIARRIGAREELVQAIKAEESGLSIEALNRNTTLNISRLEKDLGIMPPDIWKTIEDVCGL